jgi:hypothetical protein
LRIAIFAVPGGIEEILRLIARANEPDVRAIAERFRIEALGPDPF